MTHHTDHEEKRAAIRMLQKRIRKDWTILFSQAALVIVPLLTVLAGEASSLPGATGHPGEFGRFLGELSTGSILFIAAIWIVPLMLMIQGKWQEIGANRVLLTELKQS